MLISVVSKLGSNARLILIIHNMYLLFISVVFELFHTHFNNKFAKSDSNSRWPVDISYSQQ